MIGELWRDRGREEGGTEGGREEQGGWEGRREEEENSSHGDHASVSDSECGLRTSNFKNPSRILSASTLNW